MHDRASPTVFASRVRRSRRDLRRSDFKPPFAGAAAGAGENRFPVGLAGLAGGIAHEFNNLLGAVQGFAGIIVEDTGKDSLVGAHAARIVGACRHGLDIVEQILIASGRSKPDATAFDLSHLIGAVAGEFAGVLPPRIALHAAQIAAGITITADRKHIERAVVGLCGNALDAMAGRSGCIAIAIGPPGPAVLRRLSNRSAGASPWAVDVAQDGDTVYAICGALPLDGLSVTVTDSGEGMEGEVLQRAFDPFFTTRERALHAGLGLSVVLGVALAHGGGIVIASRPDHGTAVHLVLPRQRDAVFR